MRIVALVSAGLALLAAGQDATATAAADPFADALQAAKDAYDRVGQLRDEAVGQKSSEAINDRVVRVNDEVEAVLKVKKHRLEVQFANDLREAKAALAAHNTTLAEQLLEGMSAADEKLDTLGNEWRHRLKQGSKALDKESHQEARDSQELADKMARVTREKTDFLDNVARQMNRNSPAEDLDRASEGAAREMEDAAEKATRKIEDKLDKLSDAVDDTLAAEAKERRKAMKQLKKNIKQAEQLANDEEAAPKPTALLEDPVSSSFPFWLVLPGFALSALVIIRRRGTPVDKSSEYMQIV